MACSLRHVAAGGGDVQVRLLLVAAFVLTPQGMPPLHCEIRRMSKLRAIAGTLSSANAASPAERHSSLETVPLHDSQKGDLQPRLRSFVACESRLEYGRYHDYAML